VYHRDLTDLLFFSVSIFSSRLDNVHRIIARAKILNAKMESQIQFLQAFQRPEVKEVIEREWHIQSKD
jgi:hypothetical protein